MKKEYISNIEEAIKSIESMASSINLLHSGNKMFAEKTLVSKVNTNFAKWYYGDGEVFSSFTSFKKIASYYNTFYDAYQNYYLKYNEPVKKGFFSSNKSQIEDELNDLLDNVDIDSNSLVNVIKLFKTELLASPLYNEPAKKTVVVESKQEEKISVDRKTSEELDYEKKLYEEVARVKKQLEEDYQNKMSNIDTVQKELKYKLAAEKSPKKKDDFNMDDEIRRILS